MPATSLRVLRLDGSEEIFPLQGSPVSIGKNDDASGIVNDLAIEDATVSRRHARLALIDGEWWIEDLGSRNHTLVNDERIERRRLYSGDRIGIGLTTIWFDEPRSGSMDPIDVAVREEELDASKTVDLNYIILERLSEAVARAADPDEFFAAALELVMKSVRTDRASFVVAEANGGFAERVSAGIPGGCSLEAAALASASRRSQVLESREPGGPIHRVLAAPLVREGRTVAVLLLESSRRSFDANDLTLASAVANQAAAGLERLMLITRVREETLVRASLERFFSPAVAAKIARESGGSGLALRPEKVEASILFTDIRSFTGLTERFSAIEIADLLKEHFSVMTDIVFARGGVLDKFIGDSLMAVFGPPSGSPGHAADAAACALDLMDAHEVFRSSLPEAKRFDIRIGVNSGEVVAGYMGSPRRMEYTVLGKPVVVAKRLESLAPPNGALVGEGLVAAFLQAGGSGVAFEPAEGLLEPKSGEELRAFRPRRSAEGRE